MIKKMMFTFLKRHLIISGLLSAALLAMLFAFAVYFAAFLLGPPQLMNEQNTTYYSADLEVIGEESGTAASSVTRLKDISPDLVKATILVEDRRFYEHHGFDFRRIFGAIVSDIKNMSLKEGASTISQQLARNIYLSFEKTWTRKLKEAFYTIRLEMYYSKDEILEAYLNSINYGHGSYGIEAASSHFFDKTPAELDLAEAAMLAGIPKGPSYYSPFNDPERAKKRQELILNLLRQSGYISDRDYRTAVSEKLQYVRNKEDEEEIAPYFRDAAAQEAAKMLDIDTDAVKASGFQIYTTLDTSLQKQLEEKMNDTIAKESQIEVGALALHPDNGGIRALVGGRDYGKSAFNRAINAKRMPGSTFKPFLYYAALKHGYTPSTKLMSKPTAFTLDDGTVYKPGNFNGYYANAPITLAQALALSDNIYAVKTNMYLGADMLPGTAKDFGIDSDLPAVPSLALGSATVTVKEMAAGYGMIANGGKELEAHTVSKIVDPHGKTVYERDNKDGKQVLDPKQTFLLTHLMTGMFDSSLDGYMAVTGSTIADELTHTYAGKSGTTNSDSWMIGYSPALVTAVWTGYDDNRKMEVVKETGYAKNIWAAFMEAAHADSPDKKFNVPDGVVGIPIDPSTGLRATSYCPSSRLIYFEKGTEPKDYCTDHLPNGKKTHSKKGKKGKLEKLFDLFR
jgi:1A family penicillin-binding protein